MNIAYPFSFTTDGRTARARDDAHVRGLIEQFLFTNPGERVNRPDFGAGLLQLVFSPNSPELASALEFTVQSGLQRWLGDLVEVRRLEVLSEDSRLYVKIDYLIRRTGEVRSEVLQRGGTP